MASERDEFLGAVSRRANVPEADAADLVKDFLHAFSQAVDESTWQEVKGMIPLPLEDQGDREGLSLTMEEFLVELSGDEPVADERAAGHARAVAGAIRESASDSEFEALVDAIEDEGLLALFEEERGELTAVPEPSDGDIAQHTPPVADREETPPAEEANGVS